MLVSALFRSKYCGKNKAKTQNNAVLISPIKLEWFIQSISTNRSITGKLNAVLAPFQAAVF